MTVGVVGSRSLKMDIPEGLISDDVTMIYSGGAVGMDRSARRYGIEHRITVTEILPEYNLYGRSAPLKRNDWIIRMSDFMYIFWDGKSRGSGYVIKQCRKTGKPYALYIWKEDRFVKADEEEVKNV